MTASQPKQRHFYANFLLLISIILLSACQTTPRHSATMAALSPNSQLTDDSVREQLLDQYQSWKGVRYRLGGSSKGGIDCSAFVQRTFREQFGLRLPRTTRAQQNVGSSVKKQQLQAGDLVLFQTGRRTKHVGIYLGDDQFVHASTSQGVMISRLDNPYWSQHYRQARRVLNE